MYIPRLLTIIVGWLLIIAPFALWAWLRFPIRPESASAPQLLELIRTARWITWCLAVAWFLLFIVIHQFGWPIGMALGACSAGLAMPQKWLKDKIFPPNP